MMFEWVRCGARFLPLVALALLFAPGRAEAQCPCHGGQGPNRSQSMMGASPSPMMMQLAARQQMQRNVMMAAMQQQQNAMLMAAMIQQQNAMLALRQQQQNAALAGGVQQPQLNAGGQQRVMQVPARR